MCIEAAIWNNYLHDNIAEYIIGYCYRITWTEALVPWLKLPAWIFGNRELEPRSGI